ncbi:hypothetical protein [Moritella sp. 28]|uniref:hypothetical protein n=1 Tax=Moritella sp. 28 TaxID=2746232 RepID=UPI001BA809C0|nr:hypothetical protein [Moritella sp. 28]QUM83591.1 hypothetical protein HWV02_03180 [Moritella sp. 28]
MIKFLMSFLLPDGVIRGARFYNAIIILLARYVIPAWFSLNKSRIDLKKQPLSNNEQIIISLTSFGERVYQLHWCLESLFRQSYAPTRIILWLAEDEFNDDSLPSNLKMFIELGLEVRYCEDLRSHKKYFGTFKLWPNAVVVTVDDDVFYPENMLEGLLENYNLYPNCISCYRAHSIKLDKNVVAPYLNWKFASPGITGPSHTLMAVGVGGVLYPPGSLHDEVLYSEVFKTLCFYADDLWLKVMGYRAGTPVVKVRPYSKTLFSVQQTQGETLSEQNVLCGRNDIQLKSILSYYNMSGIEFFEREV